MRKFGFTSLLGIFLCLCGTLVLSAQEVEEATVSPQESSVNPENVTPADLDFYSIAEKFSLRLGGGYCVSLLDFEFLENGTFGGAPSTIFGSSVNQENSAAFILEAKYSPLDFVGFGISLDYNLMPIKNLVLDTTTGTTQTRITADVGDLHLISTYIFLEFRRPFKLSKGVLAPYAKAGLGAVGIAPDFDTSVLRIDSGMTLGTILAGGIEIFLEGHKNFSFFAEGRWHYSFSDFKFRPDSTSEYSGTVELENMSLLLGVNFYFQ